MLCGGCEKRAELLRGAVTAAKFGKMSEVHKQLWAALRSAGEDALAAVYRSHFDDDEVTPGPS